MHVELLLENYIYPTAFSEGSGNVRHYRIVISTDSAEDFSIVRSLQATPADNSKVRKPAMLVDVPPLTSKARRSEVHLGNS